jgi:hypothetical protein
MGQSREQKGNQEWNNPESKGVIKNGTIQRKRQNMDFPILLTKSVHEKVILETRRH